jgi:hypothetical protein
MNGINKEYLRIQKNITNWNKKLENLRATCTHPNTNIKHCGNTGNYDPMADCYWNEYHCFDCDKRWTIDL